MLPLITSLILPEVLRKAFHFIGDSMLQAFLECSPEVAVGKVLIQRDEATAEPIFFYKKLPSLLNKNVFLLDPMIGKIIA